MANKWEQYETGQEVQSNLVCQLPQPGKGPLSQDDYHQQVSVLWYPKPD